MHPKTRLVYFYFVRVNFLVKASTSGRRDQVRLPWQRCTCQSKYGCFRSSPQVTYLHTKIEGGLKFFISNFASLSRRIALKFRVSKIQSPTKPLVKKSVSNPKFTCCSAFSSSFHFSNISRSSSMLCCSADSRFLCDDATRTVILLFIKLKYFNKTHIQKHHLRYAAGPPIPSVR